MFVDATSLRFPECSPAVQIRFNKAQYPPAVASGLNGWTMPPDRESVIASGNELLDDFEPMIVERRRLEAELAAAKQRTFDARTLQADREAAITEALRVELESSRAAIAELERHHAEAVATVQASGRAEVESILAEARRRVAQLTESTTEPGSGPVPDVS
jgi:hypothetical protein